MKSEVTAELADRLQRAQSPAEVRAVLGDLSARIGPELPEEDWEPLLDRAVQALHDATSTDPQAAGQAILSDLVPLCFRRDLSEHFRWAQYRRFCVEWVNELPDQTRSEVRATLCATAAAALDTPQVEGALGLVSVLGYAEPAVLTALELIVASGDPWLGDRALAVLARLHPAPDRVAAARAELHRRMRLRWNTALVNVAATVGDTETLDHVFDEWLTGTGVSAPFDAEPWLFEVTLGLVPTISGRHPAGGLPTQAWSRLLAVPDRARESVGEIIRRTGSLATKTATPAVIPTLAHWAAQAEGLHRNGLYCQLAECALPAQLTGWDDVPDEDLAVPRRDALAADTQRGHWVTIEFRQKMEAWRVLLSCARAAVVPPFDDALAGETNGFVCGELLELAACVPPATLPARVRSLLAGPPELAEWEKSESLAAHIGAIQAAHGSGSREAFEALFSFQPPGQGVLLSLVRALADTASGMFAAGDPEPIERLLRTAQGTGKDYTREAAGGAIGILLGQGRLSKEAAGQAVRLAVDPAIDPFSRRDLLYALAARRELECPEDVLGEIRRVAAGARPLSPDELKAGLRRAAVVAASSRVSLDTDPRFPAECLGLTPGRGGFEYPGEVREAGAVVYALGLQFERAPAVFAPAVARIIRAAQPAAVAQLMPAVRRVGSGLPEDVRTALAERVRGMDEGRSFEPSVLRALADASPATIVEALGQATDRWLPQARADLAEVLERMGSGVERLTARRFEALVRLAGDGLYAVRRNAYRALAAVDPEGFAGLLASWAAVPGATGEGLRRRAAEGAGWLPAVPIGSPIGALVWDTELSVREAYARSAAERDERRAAVEYESHVLAARDQAGVLRGWRYGAALGRVGDDRTVERLDPDDHIDLAPAVRFWLDRVRKAVKKRWDEATRKWPEPWVTRRGFIEPLEGVVRAAGGRETQVHGFLWRTTPEQPNSYYGWGGWADEAVPDLTSEHELRVPGRAPVPILVTSSGFPGGRMVFRGNGPYPGDATDADP